MNKDALKLISRLTSLKSNLPVKGDTETKYVSEYQSIIKKLKELTGEILQILKFLVRKLNL